MFSLRRAYIIGGLCFSVLPFFWGVAEAYQLVSVEGYARFLRVYFLLLLFVLLGFAWLAERAQPPRLPMSTFCLGIAFFAFDGFLVGGYVSLTRSLLALLFLLLLEVKLRDYGILPRWYFRTRLFTSVFISMSVALIVTAEL